MIRNPQQYSRKQTLDLETAMGAAVLRAIDREYPGPGGEKTIRFRQLFEDWPAFEDNHVGPAAVVLPGNDITYGPTHPTPKLLEETWETPGQAGLGLYELSEATREFDVQFRAATTAERNALKAGLESLFATIGPPPDGTFNGLQVALTEYWGLTGYVSLLRSRKLDDQETVAKNINEGRITVTVTAPLVALRPVQPFRVRIKLYVDGQPVNRRRA